jgi:DNA mismatch endonuclease, patch repair protein
MRANKGRDTGPEMRLRRALHASGMRYRVNARLIPGSRMTIDIAFPRARVAVEVRGCFWHGCTEHHRPSRQNADFWTTKIKGNVERDETKRSVLTQMGWKLVVVWEHDDVANAVDRVIAAVLPGVAGS